MCAVLCRTWLPKSKAELVGRGFDIGVASSSSLPLSQLGRSFGPWDGGMMSALYTTPSVRSSPSLLLLCQTSCSLARSLAGIGHSLTHPHLASLRPFVRATPVRRPAHHPSIPFFVMPLQLTIKANRRSERASESASVAANEEASSKWSASECGAMGDAASSPSHLNNNRARG